jgi:hypothetical protein
MTDEQLEAVRVYIRENIDEFHNNRLNKIQNLRLTNVLKRKNPYLYKAKNVSTALEFVSSILDAYLSSSEEEAMGHFLEELAIYVAESTYGGQKSTATGIDLDFTREGVRYLVAIKSGPNWGNSQQYSALRANFRNALVVVRQRRREQQIQPVLGICYGNFRTTDTGLYLKIGGQSFWELISGSPNLYLEIIESLGYEARRHNEGYLEEKGRTYARFAEEFEAKFMENGRIVWERLVQFSSSNLTPQRQLEEVGAEVATPIPPPEPVDDSEE